MFVFTFAQTPFITFKAKENHPLEGGFSFELGMGMRRPVQAASVFTLYMAHAKNMADNKILGEFIEIMLEKCKDKSYVLLRNGS